MRVVTRRSYPSHALMQPTGTTVEYHCPAANDARYSDDACHCKHKQHVHCVEAVAAGAAPLLAERAIQLAHRNENTTPFLLREKVPSSRKLLKFVIDLSTRGLVVPGSASGYDSVRALCEEILDEMVPLFGVSRVFFCEPDGTTIVDTAKGAKNTYANYKDKSINENHNTRVAIACAQQFPAGTGAEKKNSTSTGRVETSAAKRVGKQFDTQGTIRCSFKNDA